MIIASYKQYILNFKQASGTSRGVLKTKETWFLILNSEGKQGIGECGVFRGLSVDDRPDYEDKLKWLCKNIHLDLDFLLNELIEFPSIQFGLEMAMKSFNGKHQFELFPSKFTESTDSIPINGLIWMGSEAFMKQQITDKIAAGFSCIKMKIGAIDFQTEINLLKSIRKEFTSKDIELRVDANGAFLPSEALEKLKILSDLDLHSIEQPIKQGQFSEMKKLCKTSPFPIALDEELIGITDFSDKVKLLEQIQPQYIILKPTLLGGIKAAEEWISLAKEREIGWWVTSALESNIGLNAIAQFVANYPLDLPQGLGTGQLYGNNINSPLEMDHGYLRYNSNKSWDLNQLF